MKTWLAGALAAIVSFAFAACSAGDPAMPSSQAPEATSADAPTFHRDVAPILQQRCQSCHVVGGIAPFSLVTYADARAMSAPIVAMTQSKQMPPWGAHDTEDCKLTRPLRADMRLTDAELRTLEVWDRNGAPEGNPADAPPPITPPRNDLASPSATLRSDVGFAMSGTNDELRCFVLDPKLTEDTFITATNVVPEHAGVVHHVLVFVDEAGESKKNADANGQYECFGGPKISQPTLLTGWAPGGVPNELPDGVALQVPKGSLLVMQVHYHAAPGVNAPPDRTSVQLRYADKKPSYIALPRLIGNFEGSLPGLGGLMSGPNDPASGVEFVVPPNVANHTETMKITIPKELGGQKLQEMKLLGAGGHMHYVGVSEQISISRAAPKPSTPKDECLLSIPRWDFDWQRGYAYDVPIDDLPTVAPDDELTIKCTYDNTMQNPKMGRALREAGLTSPVAVKLGESTLEEMCLGSFMFVVPAP